MLITKVTIPEFAEIRGVGAATPYLNYGNHMASTILAVIPL
jgi:hypothetical protein